MAANITESPDAMDIVTRANLQYYTGSAVGGAEPELKCDRYYAENHTHFIYGGYEGIPENLLLNFVVWVVSRQYPQ